MQNSQRVLLAMPRRRDGDITPYRYGTRVWGTATGHESGALRGDTSGGA